MIASGRPEISLILPAFNEMNTIAQTVSEVKSYFERRGKEFEIIVAADGDDGTRELMARLGIKVIGDKTRRGKGRGVREGVALATGATIGYADADNKVPIEEFEQIEQWLGQGYDVVIGSRALRESRIESRQTFYRRVGSAGFSVLLHAVIGLKGIDDTQCGFKFFTSAAAKDLFRRQKIDGYMFDVEILALATRLGYRIKQVPIRWRDDGDSRLELLRGNVRNMIDIYRIRRAAREASP